MKWLLILILLAALALMAFRTLKELQDTGETIGEHVADEEC